MAGPFLRRAVFGAARFCSGLAVQFLSTRVPARSTPYNRGPSAVVATSRRVRLHGRLRQTAPRRWYRQTISPGSFQYANSHLACLTDGYPGATLAREKLPETGREIVSPLAF